jgi:hypothetical protein
MMALNARTKKKITNPDFTLFDVFYEDGSQISNRKVPVAELEAEDKEGAVKAYLEAQDRKIGEASGNPRGAIKLVVPTTIKTVVPAGR